MRVTERYGICSLHFCCRVLLITRRTDPTSRSGPRVTSTTTCYQLIESLGSCMHSYLSCDRSIDRLPIMNCAKRGSPSCGVLIQLVDRKRGISLSNPMETGPSPRIRGPPLDDIDFESQSASGSLPFPFPQQHSILYGLKSPPNRPNLDSSQTQHGSLLIME